MQEYIEDFSREFPDKAMALGPAENVQFVTGDPDIDNLEARIARGDDITENDLIDSVFGKDGGDVLRASLEAKERRRRSLLTPGRNIQAPKDAGMYNTPTGAMRKQLDDEYTSGMKELLKDNKDW